MSAPLPEKWKGLADELGAAVEGVDETWQQVEGTEAADDAPIVVPLKSVEAAADALDKAAELAAALQEVYDGYLDAPNSTFGWHAWGERAAAALTTTTSTDAPPEPNDGALYECPNCYRVAPWTDGTGKALGDERDEFWCQTCGEEIPLERCRRVEGSSHV